MSGDPFSMNGNDDDFFWCSQFVLNNNINEYELQNLFKVVEYK